MKVEFLSVDRRGFTLIELLIVVAIIAILAAIAVPNFLEAQVRSKVSRAKSDVRVLATGLEAYYVDNNAYPQGNPFNTSGQRKSIPGDPMILERLSTPVSYITTGVLVDPFLARTRSGVPNPTTGASTPAALTPAELEQEGTYKYAALVKQPSSAVLALVSTNNRANTFWIAWTAGPDSEKTQLGGTGLLSTSPMATTEACLAYVYDPTNGSVSRGDIFRVGGTSTGSTNPGGVFYSTVTRVQ